MVQQRLDRVVLAGGTASVGGGRPLVYVMGWLTHLQLSWELPAERALYEALAQGCRRYDRAGCGLSAAEVGADPSVDAGDVSVGAGGFLCRGDEAAEDVRRGVGRCRIEWCAAGRWREVDDHRVHVA
jgi:hypothetical protein